MKSLLVSWWNSEEVERIGMPVIFGVVMVLSAILAFTPAR